jgi:hypothetical protein
VNAVHALLGWQILFVVSVLAPVALLLSLSLVMRRRSRRFRTVSMPVQVAAWLLVHAVVPPGRFELPPLPPEGDNLSWNGANRWQLPRDFNVFRSPWIASERLVFREVMPFCCHG